MPKFKVLRRVDAWIDYVAEVDAEDELEAAVIARHESERHPWRRVGEEELQHSRFVALDSAGEELEETLQSRG